MSRKTVLAMAMIVGILSVSGWSQSDASLANENVQLKQRVDNLEKQVEALTATLSPEEQAATKALAAGKQSVWSNLDIQFYGFLKADAAFDNSRTTSGNYVFYVDRENARKNDDEFNMTANESRLGLKIGGPKDGNIQTSGQVEFDFFGNYADENKAKIQMRHAFINLQWVDSGFSLLAGQTWDVISPLNPTSLNYPVLWSAGNIGYRRPQIRVTKEHMLSGDTSLKFQAAIARTIGRSSDIGAGATSESGEDAGYPTLQGRVGATFSWLPAGATTVGISGHMGKEEYDTTAAGDNTDFDSWSINIDYLQPLTNWITLKAELFRGENLNTYYGGILQGVNTTNMNEIASKGGWCAASMTPWKQWNFNAGIGIDDVDADDVNEGDRTLNRVVFTNAIYSLNKNTDVGLELSHWRTDYKGDGDADDVRVQASLKYKF